MTLVANQLVRIRAAGSQNKWTQAVVQLASANGRSVALQLEDAVRLPDGGIIAGILPLLIDYDKETVTGLMGEEYEMEPSDPSAFRYHA